ncbi:hypothetical protein LU293_04625 [Moraxella nasovis]|uniref:hypothetical protein n=1 Tax=Moraxella nasovis TaxID=2904121 RepID=UPI001F614EA7|nr:hypothetical protein [Moraxella nasovis]UNU74181.1 hypothetical protein LU293_04625 [Moraxella nasovis]
MKKYPTIKVILGYALLGGLLGSLPFVWLLLFWLFFLGDDWNVLFAVVEAAVMFGTAPAFLTGLTLSLTKTRIKKDSDYWRIFTIGFVMTFLCFLITGIFDLLMDGMDVYYVIKRSVFGFLFFGIFGLIGGIASVALAKFLLPKSACPTNQSMR